MVRSQDHRGRLVKNSCGFFFLQRAGAKGFLFFLRRFPPLLPPLGHKRENNLRVSQRGRSESEGGGGDCGVSLPSPFPLPPFILFLPKPVPPEEDYHTKAINYSRSSKAAVPPFGRCAYLQARDHRQFGNLLEIRIFGWCHVPHCFWSHISSQNPGSGTIDQTKTVFPRKYCLLSSAAFSIKFLLRFATRSFITAESRSRGNSVLPHNEAFSSGRFAVKTNVPSFSDELAYSKWLLRPFFRRRVPWLPGQLHRDG